MNISKTFSTPILLVIFNRPETTAKVFEAIRKIKPSTLYIAADGPRAHKEGEKELCLATRKVVENVDWECDVHTKFSEINQGCKISVSESITWFFSEVEQGIILEDDCVPDDSFFPYCEELLNKYKNDTRVKMISGNNFRSEVSKVADSYYFSYFPNIWGWATWRRAWNDFDLDMKSFPQFKKDEKIKKLFKNKDVQTFMVKLFESLYLNKMNTWAGRWLYAILSHEGVSITPSKNLVSNIGFGEDATHTKESNDQVSNLPVSRLENLTHPVVVEVNEQADTDLYYGIYHKTLLQKILRRLHLG
jgi:hypothetical protein